MRRKMVADVVLDTIVKNGHTSTSDALWAGVPVVALRGVLPHSRASIGLMANAGKHVNVTEVFSLKDYEDL